MARPVHLLQRGVDVDDVVNITTIAVVEAQDTALLTTKPESVTVAPTTA